MTYFNNKVVWITGASSGIGEALAVAFARQGAKLILSARREDELNRVKESLGLADDCVLVLPMDVTDFGAMPAKTQAVVGTFGRIDIVVHNAGVSQRARVEDTELNVYQQLMDVNFFSIVALTKAILPVMKQQKNGHFVMIASVAGKVGTIKRSGYNAAKHALIGFSDSLRAEVYDDNMRVTVVCPGYIKTNISLNALQGDGTPQNKIDQDFAKGLAPELLARKVLSAIENEKNEIVVAGFTETAAVWLRRIWPNLLFEMVRRTPPK